MTTLKECPFCGGEAKAERRSGPDILSGFPWLVWCPSCAVRTGNHGSREGAETAWNRRGPLENPYTIARLRVLLEDGRRLMAVEHDFGKAMEVCPQCEWMRRVQEALIDPAKLEDAADSFLRNTAKMGKEPASSPDLNDAKWPGSCCECEQECDPKCPRFASASKPKVVRTPLGARLDAVVKALMEWADHAAGKGDSATSVVLRGLARELDKE